MRRGHGDHRGDGVDAPVRTHRGAAVRARACTLRRRRSRTSRSARPRWPARPSPGRSRARGAAAKESTTGLVLSTDAKLDKTDVKLGSASQKAIKAGKTGDGQAHRQDADRASPRAATRCWSAPTRPTRSRRARRPTTAGPRRRMTIAAPPAGGGTTPAPSTPAPGGGAPAPVITPPAFQPTAGADRDAHRHGDRHGHAGAVLHAAGRVPRRHLAAAERALRVQRQRGRRRLRVPAGRRGVRRHARRRS